ncbi:alpha/beta hydrolase [Mucilaginibacter polytrichastri]|uniref:Alpha/beta hydrolase n=1 Tax=Mucilaginibacter polytrichastri TaxID=1302689 RepID=A0A1Q5ZY81_9SPHI|nr:alpha/beta hydrolase [Mucilaginibacter polytrichastri]OKS86723.1 hypothetical protein RG47T_2180 [Mucilaginibacter polytrichastri]SFS82727.1 hypothetical protein SAMN04487890_104288 [Mucilaginibacter polytrichastri]
MKDNPHQAVIIVHGMGEQRPMDTLRGFVEGVKWQMEQNDPSEKNAKVRSKPDSIGDIYETVRLSLESNFSAKRPITDFYEFYWAHNMRGTKFSQMGTWLRQVIFRQVNKVPKQLQRVWWTVWGLFIIATIISLAISYWLKIPGWFKPIIAILGGTLFSALWTSITAFVKTSFLNSLGDVARYMTPEPDNISERKNIRQQGITFLRKLHTIATHDKPDRIIVVAHSLGSVVAYDLLRLLWTEYNTVYTIPPPNNAQPALDSLNTMAQQPGALPGNFAEAQNQLWQESRSLGNPWLVSDFITLGAALNAIDYFMVNKVPIEQLIEQREIPVCPPEIDTNDHNIYYRQFFDAEEGKNRKGVNVLNHGALFGMIRWTNIFYASDFVGGPMQRVFGKGVKDISVKRKSLWCYPGGHTEYWTGGKPNQALEEIVNALKL